MSSWDFFELRRRGVSALALAPGAPLGPRCSWRPAAGALATRATGGVLARIRRLGALVLPLALLPRGIRPTRVFGQRGPELVAHGH